MFSGFEGLDLSHEGVKCVVGLFTGFVFAIASTPYGFLYLNQLIHDIKNSKIKKAPYLLLCPHLLAENLPRPPAGAVLPSAQTVLP